MEISVVVPVFNELENLRILHDEIAEVMDCPLGTVMSRMSRARRALRERLADYAQSRGLVVESRP